MRVDMHPTAEQRVRMELANCLQLAGNLASLIGVSATLEIVDDDDQPHTIVSVKLREYRTPLRGRARTSQAARRNLHLKLREQQADKGTVRLGHSAREDVIIQPRPTAAPSTTGGTR